MLPGGEEGTSRVRVFLQADVLAPHLPQHISNLPSGFMFAIITWIDMADDRSEERERFFVVDDGPRPGTRRAPRHVHTLEFRLETGESTLGGT